MSISEPKVDMADGTAASAAAEASNFAIPSRLDVPGRQRGTKAPTSPYRTITDRELTLVQVCCDFICACIALPVALIVLSMLSSVPTNAASELMGNLKVDSFFPLAVVAALALGGVYRVTNRRLQPSAFLEMRELGFGVGAGCVLALAVGSILHGTIHAAEPFATQLVVAVIAAVGTITVGRIVLRFFLRTLTTTRVLVVGSGMQAERIMTSVGQDPGMTLVGRVVDAEVADAGVLGRVTDLPTLCGELDVQRILVAASDEFSTQSLDVYRQLQGQVHIAMVPRFYELISWRSGLTDLAGMPFLEIAQPHLSPWDQVMKRAFDLVVSTAVLVLAAPLLVAVAVGVKMSSPGPVFFHQARIGRRGQPFTLMKFRSMTVDTDTSAHAPQWVGQDLEGLDGVDPMDTGRPLHEVHRKADEVARITRFGAFMRHSGIDEIPQFINVFKGDMSVVGPRPFVPSESRVEGWGSRRFDVRPGITGLWQVSGRNQLTRADLVQLDYVYVASWSLWWDLKIMAETPKTMARGSGAY